MSLSAALVECAIRVPSGLCCGYLFHRTRSVVPPVVMHLLSNYWISDI
jgi:membrane protease YdiL (CAAX protease family)